MARKRKCRSGSLNHHQEFNEYDKMDGVALKEPTNSQPTRRKRIEIKCRNEKQKNFLRTIEEHDITLCTGPAGCGKSYLSVIKALKYLFDPSTSYEKIYIITPLFTSKSARLLGSLPGTLEEKASFYTNSTYRIIDKVLDSTFGKGKGKVMREEMIEQEQIELLALPYIKGETIENSILVFEESEDADKQEFKSLLTRIGENSKFIISGDIDQIDAFKRKSESGLVDAIERFSNCDEIGIFQFGEGDSVRHPIINKLLKYYND